MNAVLNINIRVASQQAQAQLGAIRSTIASLSAIRTGNLSAGFAGFGQQLSSVGSKMISFGKNVSWTGRQIQQTFTLPILAAGGAATYFALKNEAAFTQLRKVYGLADSSIQNVNGELQALNRTMELLSDTFGVNQAEVSGVAKAWAEAGSSGVGLQKSVFISLEAAAVGTIDLTKASEGLIAIQSAYRLNTDQLRLALAQLNTIQVQSGISFSGMIDVVARSGGVARTAGIDIQHLAAMAAAIVPAAGSATQAGNALKTIISRILAPTKQAADMLENMGIQVDKSTWQALNGSQRLEEVARAFGNLSDAQKTLVSSTIAGRFQINRFDILMDDINRSTGFYRKSLETTADNTKTLALYQQQLLTVLESSPQKMKILWTMLQNALAKIIIPMIPALTGLVARIVGLVQSFTRLSPQTQQFILFGLAMLAIFGPFIRYLSTTIELFGVLLKVAGWNITSFGKLIGWIQRMMAAHQAAAMQQMWAAASAAKMQQGAYAKTTAASTAAAGASAAAWTGAAAITAGSAVAGSAVVTRIWSNTAKRMAGAAALGSGAWTGGMVAIGTGSVAAAGTALIPWAGAAGVIGVEAGLAEIAWTGAMRELAVSTTLATGVVEEEFLALEAGPTLLALGMGEATASIAAKLATISTELQSTGVIWAGIPGEVVPLWIAGAEGIESAWTVSMATIEGVTLETIGAMSTAWNTAIAEITAGMAIIAPAALEASTGATGALIGPVAAEIAAVGEILNAEVIKDVAVVEGAMAAIDGSIIEATVIMGELGAGAVAASEVLQAEFIADAAVIEGALGAIDAGLLETYLVMGELPMVAGEAALETAGVLGGIAAAIAALPIELVAAIVAIVALLGVLAWNFRKQLGSAIQWLISQFARLPGIIASVFRSIVSVISGAMSSLFGGGGGNQQAATKQITQQAQQTQKAVAPLANKKTAAPPAAPKKSPLEDFMTQMFSQTETAAPKLSDAQKAMNDAIDKASKLGDAGGGGQKKVLSSLGRSELDAFIKLLPQLDSALNSSTGDMKAQTAAIGDWKLKLDDTIDSVKLADERMKMLEIAPDAVPSLDALIARLTPLKALMNDLYRQVQAQQTVVDGWKQKLDESTRALKDASDQLDILKDKASAAQNALSDAKDVLQKLVDTPIEGMKAMDDAIFENSMQVKGLKLQILQLEESGMSIDAINKKLSEMRGVLETLKGERENLRLMGAGSEILGGYDEQIKTLEDSISSLEGTGSPITALQKQLDDLQRQGEELDLEKALKFDPLEKKIKDVTGVMKEMPFDELYGQIVNQQGVVDTLTKAWEDAEAAVKPQQAIVDSLKIKHDEIQKTYDTESDKLSVLKDNYDNVKSAVDGLTGALDNMFSTAGQQDVSNLQGQFDAAKGFDFADVGGTSQIGREGDLFDMEAFNKALEESVSQMGAGLGKIDMWKPFKDMAGSIVDWMKDHAAQIAVGIVVAIGLAIFTALGGWAIAAIAILAALLAKPIWEALKWAWKWAVDSLWPFLTGLFAPIGSFFQAIWNGVGTALQWVWENIVQPIWNAIIEVINATVVPAFQFLGEVWGVIWGAIQQVLQGAWDIIKPIWDAMVGFINGYIIPILQLWGAIFDIIMALIFKVVKFMWDNVGPILLAVVGFIGGSVIWIVQHLGDIVSAVFGAIGTVISAAWNSVIFPVLNAIWGFISGTLGPIFSWLWDSIITPVFNGIGTVITGAWNNVIKPVLQGIWDFINNTLAPVFGWLWHNIIEPAMNGIAGVFTTVWGGIKNTLKTVANFFIRAFNMIADAITSVADWLGIKVEIKHMQEIGDDAQPMSGGGGGAVGGGGGGVAHAVAAFATGGVVPITSAPSYKRVSQMQVGAGFKTRLPRAIVGEGSRLHPEYVIPTDPAHRANAMKLMQQAIADLGIQDLQSLGVPGHLFGSVMDAVGGAITTGLHVAGSVVSTARKGAVMGIAQPFLAAADAAIGLIPSHRFQDFAKHIKNEVYNWLKGEDAKLPTQVPKAYNGALVKGSTNGTLIRAGDGNKDELIYPFPNKLNENSGRTLNFYGDLSFPNITTGDDAEQFLKNLERLAG